MPLEGVGQPPILGVGDHHVERELLLRQLRVRVDERDREERDVARRAVRAVQVQVRRALRHDVDVPVVAEPRAGLDLGRVPRQLAVQHRIALRGQVEQVRLHSLGGRRARVVRGRAPRGIDLERLAHRRVAVGKAEGLRLAGREREIGSQHEHARLAHARADLADRPRGRPVPLAPCRDRVRRRHAARAEERRLLRIDVGDVAGERGEEGIAGVVIDGVRRRAPGRARACREGPAQAEHARVRVPRDPLVEHRVARVALPAGRLRRGREGDPGDQPVDLDGPAGDVPVLVVAQRPGRGGGVRDRHVGDHHRRVARRCRHAPRDAHARVLDHGLGVPHAEAPRRRRPLGPPLVRRRPGLRAVVDPAEAPREGLLRLVEDVEEGLAAILRGDLDVAVVEGHRVDAGVAEGGPVVAAVEPLGVEERGARVAVLVEAVLVRGQAEVVDDPGAEDAAALVAGREDLRIVEARRRAGGGRRDVRVVGELGSRGERGGVGAAREQEAEEEHRSVEGRWFHGLVSMACRRAGGSRPRPRSAHARVAPGYGRSITGPRSRPAARRRRGSRPGRGRCPCARRIPAERT